MLIIRGANVSPRDKKLLTAFSKYVMDRFVMPCVQKTATIIIKFTDGSEMEPSERKELNKFWAWMVYDGVKNGKRHFTVTIDKKTLTRNAKNPLKRLKNALGCIGHELVHVKQYLNNECFDYKDGSYRYKKNVYRHPEASDEDYWASPIEIEAYGYETALYQLYVAKMKKEAKG